MERGALLLWLSGIGMLNRVQRRHQSRGESKPHSRRFESENAALAERDAIAADVDTVLTRVASDQLADARDRLASRLELLTS